MVLNKEFLFGPAKIHKATEDGIPSSHPILSVIGTPSYELATFCHQLLKPPRNNEYTILFFIFKILFIC